MAWNRSLPANATKLRLTPSILQGNWDAIEFGLVPYDYIRLQKQSIAPSRIAGHGLVYGVDPGSGFVELYYRDDRNPSLQTRLTNNGGAGAPGQLLYGSAVVLSGTYQNVQNSFISAYGRCVATASGFSGTPFHLASCTRDAQGEYTIETDTSFLSGDICIVGTCQRPGSSTPGGFNWITKTFSVNKVTITCETKNRDGQNRDIPFDVIIVGGK